MGAADYLVKPVRLQECKSFRTKMKIRDQEQAQEKPLFQGIAKYEFIKPIGQGSAGTVSVYKSKVDGKQYALKEIDLTFMSERDKKSAQNEVQFLRVLKGPTIVTFYESFKEGQIIYIVMEYAIRGTLDTAIEQKILSGNKFTVKQILRYMAHMCMAVMAMYNKNILHRDIKT